MTVFSIEAVFSELEGTATIVAPETGVSVETGKFDLGLSGWFHLYKTARDIKSPPHAMSKITQITGLWLRIVPCLAKFYPNTT
jgi:hypothetical protein